MKPKTLQQAIKYFSDPQNCMDWLKAKRWPDGVPVCPHCGRKDATYLPAVQKWQCKSAHKTRQFSARVGTIFEDSPIPLEKWLVALWMACNCKNGISSYELHRTIGVTQKTAWFMLHRIRLMMQDDPGYGHMTKIGGSGSEVEVDEAFVGPNPKNMHKDRRLRYNQQCKETGRGGVAVMGMLDRNAREIRAKAVPDVKRETLQGEILFNVKYGSYVFTDNAVAYNKLKWRYLHEVVNHAERYVEGRVHTNGLENFWSLFKRNLRGTYVAVEPFHLERYLSEQLFRYNNRATKEKNVTDSDRFDLALSQIVGKRLTFAEVTGKVGETSL